MFLGKIKCRDDHQSEFVNWQYEIWKRKDFKFGHYNFVGLTEQNIKSILHSGILEICLMRRSFVFKSPCRVNHSYVLQFINSTSKICWWHIYGKLQTIMITSDLKNRKCRIFLYSTLLNYHGILKKPKHAYDIINLASIFFQFEWRKWNNVM